MRFALLPTGRFITVMPRSFLRFLDARSAVKILPVEIGSWATPTMVMTLANRSLSPAAANFLATVRELATSLEA